MEALMQQKVLHSEADPKGLSLSCTERGKSLQSLQKGSTFDPLFTSLFCIWFLPISIVKRRGPNNRNLMKLERKNKIVAEERTWTMVVGTTQALLPVPNVHTHQNHKMTLTESLNGWGWQKPQAGTPRAGCSGSCTSSFTTLFTLTTIYLIYSQNPTWQLSVLTEITISWYLVSNSELVKFPWHLPFAVWSLSS